MFFSAEAIKNWWYPRVLLLCLFSPVCLAKQQLVIAGWEKPPYIIASQDSGYEIELISQVLARLDQQISMLYVPYGRTYETYKREQADIALTLTSRSGVPDELLSIPYVSYQNVAISLKKSHLNLYTISQLKELSVIAFQSASKVLGSEFGQAVKDNMLYLELPDQGRQVEMLFHGSVDVVVMDINIFNYFSSRIFGESQMDKVVVHAFFPPTHYSAAFRDARLLQDFNREFVEFKHSEAYRLLGQKYDFIYPLQE